MVALNQYIKENIIKNVLIIVVAAVIYPVILGSLEQIKSEQTNDFLLVISMILVGVCFANFAFTYERSKMQIIVGRLLSHFTTGVFMLLTALLLESIVLTVKIIYPSLHSLIFGFSILLYVGIVLYDFWDLMRV